MVKCDNCGERLSIEIIKCTNCNAVNNIAVLHYKRLAVYDKKFEQTIAEVEKHTKEYKRFLLVAMLAAFLTFPVVAAFLYAIASEQIARDMSKGLFDKNPNTYYETVEKYIEDGDYNKANIIINKTYMINSSDDNRKHKYKVINEFEFIKNDIYNMQSDATKRAISSFVNNRNDLANAIVSANESGNSKQVSIDLMQQTDNLLMWRLGFDEQEREDFWFAEDDVLADISEKKFGGDAE